MQKSYFSILLLIFFCSIAFNLSAQTDNLIRCYSVEHEEERRAANPNLPTMEEFEQWIQPLIENYKRKAATKSGEVITIPCVVHVLHNGEAVGTAPNITDAQAISQIRVLNEDFGRTNPDANLTRAMFLPVAADVELRFVMAQTDPNGNPTNGVNHFNIGQNGATRNNLENTIKPNSIWDPTQYLNMWSVKFAAPDDNLLGYAQFPDNSGLAGISNTSGANTDGVVMRYNSFGTKNDPAGATFLLDPPYDLGRTGTHEVGHWVGLRHIWGDGLGCSQGLPTPGCSCLQDDFCEDTPNSEKANYSCEGTEISNCPDAPLSADMTENYMDYSNDVCMNMFTEDQKARVLTVMANSPRRRELPNSPALFPPGTYIVFSETAASLLEGTECGGVTTKDITLTVSKAPTADATISVTTSGSATEGEDYTLSTSTVTFLAGMMTPKTITVNIFKDFASEGNETIILTLTETTTLGDAQKGFTKDVYTLNLEDDDKTPERAGVGAAQTIYSEDFESGNSGFTEVFQTGAVNWTEGFNAGLLASVGDGNSAFVSTSGTQNDYNQFISSTARYASPMIDTRGVVNMSFSFEYAVDGEDEFDYGTIEYSIDGSNWTIISEQLSTQTSPTVQTVTLPPDAENVTTLQIALRWDNDNLLGTATSIDFDNLLLTGSVQGAAAIATTATTTSLETEVRANETIHIFDQNNRIIATIENGNQPLGCTTVNILSNGNAANIPLTGVSLNTEAASKTIEVIPTNNANTATYKIWIYYTEAEINTWLADLQANHPTATVADFKLFRTTSLTVGTATVANIQYDQSTLKEAYHVNGTMGFRYGGSFTKLGKYGGSNANSVVDADADGFFTGADPDDGNACIPDNNVGNCDRDADGLTNAQEAAAGSDPDLQNTDGDEFSDFEEVNNQQSNPANNCSPNLSFGECDRDNDGLTNDEEATAMTNPVDNDTDGDGQLDGADVEPLNNCQPNPGFGGCDRDNDGLTNDEEAFTNTDAFVNDTDMDGELDGEEVGANPMNPIDTDADGMNDALESDDVDDDNDSFVNENDSANNDPCVPDAQNVACVGLPIELVDLMAMVYEKTIVLTWETASENDFYGFEIQRANDQNRTEFEKLAWINSVGTKAHYQFEDKNVQAGEGYYYRLKQVDHHGRFEYSKTITAKLKAAQDFTVVIQPNPATDQITLTPSSIFGNFLNIKILSVNGQLLKEKQVTITDQEPIQMEVGDLPIGIYLIKVGNATESFVQKLVIE